ncbi:MAG: ABC transporter permease subunit [Anaerolineae bacterium]|jgi:ABC-2 type transport system permease protein|nr:ABC transporter permease subunit [Chloroflexota bacterium]
MRNWNWRGMWAIVAKDLKQVRQNTMVWTPMVILPILLQVILPLVMILLPRMVSDMGSELSDLEPLLAAIPAELLPGIREASPEVVWVMLTSAYLFAPFFLLIPMMVTSILAADSIVGEKERKTLEGLLYLPLTDQELYLAKTLVSIIPALVITLVSFLLYTLVVNAAGYGVVGRVFFPTPLWWPLVFWLAPAVAVAALGATVLISSRATTYVQAQQSSGLLVLPVVAWMVSQATGVFIMGPGMMMLVGTLIWAIGIWLIWLGSKTLSRSRLISQV